MKTGILILGHGSKVEDANAELYQIAEMVKTMGGYDIVETAFLQLRPPLMFDGIRLCVRQGAQKIIIAPYFLYMGTHVQKDLPNALNSAKEKFPGIKIIIARHLGVDNRMAEMVCERIEECAGINFIIDETLK